MQKKINKTRYAILGMLLRKPQSGYEIKQEMLGTTAHFWQESDASIYPMLKTLESEGCVTSKTESVGKRERKIFEITELGTQEFTQWLALPAEGEPRRNELLLKIFFGANTSLDNTIQQLSLYKNKLLHMQLRFNSIEYDVLTKVPKDHPHKLFWDMALLNGKLQVQAETEWIQQCLTLLKKKKTQ